MSKLNNLIKELQLKQKKIDYLSYVADLIKTDTHCHDYMDVKKEVVDLLEPLLIKMMTDIENDIPTNQPGDGLEDSERQALKLLAKEAVKRIQTGTTKTPANSPFANPDNLTTKNPPKKIQNNQDKLSFAMNNRNLGGKKVRVLNDQNLEITGEVVGLDAPFVIVKVDQGERPTIEVPLERVSELK